MEKKNRPKLPSPQERLDLILLGLARGKPVDLLCQEAGVSRELFYRWMQRVRQGALQALEAKAPGPKRVKNTEQAAREIQRVQERMERLEREAAMLRKERDHLKVVSDVAQRIIERQAWSPPPTSAKKNAMSTKRSYRPIARSGNRNEPSVRLSDHSARPGASTGSHTGDGSESRSVPNRSDEGGLKTP